LYDRTNHNAILISIFNARPDTDFMIIMIVHARQLISHTE